MKRPTELGLVLTNLVPPAREVTALDIGQASGLYPRGTSATWADLGRLLVRHLLELGLVMKAGRGPMRYEFTERARIASALLHIKARSPAAREAAREANDGQAA